jgi:hypothetical protein
MDDMEHVQTTQSKDEARLAELGYKQELKRDWTLMHNFGVSFSIIVSSKKPRAALLRSEPHCSLELQHHQQRNYKEMC